MSERKEIRLLNMLVILFVLGVCEYFSFIAMLDLEGFPSFLMWGLFCVINVMFFASLVVGLEIDGDEFGGALCVVGCMACIVGAAVCNMADGSFKSQQAERERLNFEASVEQTYEETELSWNRERREREERHEQRPERTDEEESPTSSGPVGKL